MNTIGVAFAYAVLALFAQNAIFTRGLGVSRLIQLVGDERTSSWWFALLLCVTQTLVAPLAYFAGSRIVDLPYRAQLRPLLYLACVAVVCIFEHAILRAVKGPRSGLLIRILPIAAVNSGVLGTVLGCLLTGVTASTYCLSLSLLLAFAMLYPEVQLLLFFVIPIRVKYFGVFAAVLWVFSFLGASLPGKLDYLLSMLNVWLFFAPMVYRSLRAWVRREQWKRKNRR